MDTNSIIDSRSQRILTLALDALTLILAGIFASLCNIAQEHPLITVTAAVGFAIVLALRLWLMKLLAIHTNVSWLNLFLKWLTCILVGFVDALVILPIALIIALPLIKLKDHGPVLHRIELRRKGTTVGRGFTFRHNGSIMEDPLLQKIPVLLNLITGSISLWNLSRTEIKYIEPSETIETETYEHIQQTIFTQEQ